MAVSGQEQIDLLMKEIYQATKEMPVAEAEMYFAEVQKQHPALRKTSIEEFAGYWLHQDALEHIRNQRTSCLARPCLTLV